MTEVPAESTATAGGPVHIDLLPFMFFFHAQKKEQKEGGRKA